MTKPKAINCNYAAGRFCFAHLQNLVGAQIKTIKYNMTKAQGNLLALDEVS